MRPHQRLQKTSILSLIDELESTNPLIRPTILSRKRERQFRNSKLNCDKKENSISSAITKHSDNELTISPINFDKHKGTLIFFQVKKNSDQTKSFYKYKDFKDFERKIPDIKLKEVSIDNDDETDDDQIEYGENKLNELLGKELEQIQKDSKYLEKKLSRKLKKGIYIKDEEDE